MFTFRPLLKNFDRPGIGPFGPWHKVVPDTRLFCGGLVKCKMELIRVPFNSYLKKLLTETRGKKTWWKPVKFDNFVTIYCNIKDLKRFELNEKILFSLVCQSCLMRLSQNPGDLNFDDNALLWIPLNNTLSFLISYFLRINTLI